MNWSRLYYYAGEESTELGLASDQFPENGECGGLEINPLKDFMTVDGPNIIYNPTLEDAGTYATKFTPGSKYKLTKIDRI
jgi:hypothetical protein